MLTFSTSFPAFLDLYRYLGHPCQIGGWLPSNVASLTILRAKANFRQIPILPFSMATSRLS